VSDAIKVSCPQCSAKYRLPAEAQGRSARCKVCGTKFAVASPKSLDDSVLDWLTDQNDQEEEDLVAQPRVINMPKGSGGKRRGPIRMKESADSATPEGE
jgi:PHP family Zn ribbon phosphoesterase